MTIPILIIFKRLHLLKNGFYIMLNTIPLYKFCSRTLNYFIRIYKKFTLESILISIFALFMINNISLFKIPLYQEGDIAANALLILRAKKLELLHGNYSRFSPIAVKMIGVGEKTGKLDEAFLYLGDFFEEEVDNIAKNLSVVLEPIILLVIGLIVGFVALAIISPIYNLTGSIK